MFIYDPRAPRSQRGVRESHMALNIDIAPHYFGFGRRLGTGGYARAELVGVAG